MHKYNIAVAGTGYVGLSIATLLAKSPISPNGNQYARYHVAILAALCAALSAPSANPSPIPAA